MNLVSKSEFLNINLGDRYDSICGTPDKNDVWRHILRHGKYLMDVRIGQAKSDEPYKCKNCSSSFKGRFFSFHYSCN